MRSSFLLCLAALCLWAAPVAAQPANDDCASAIAVATGPAAVGFDTTSATTDGPAPAICFGVIAKDIWYTYTPAVGVTELQLDVCGANFDTKLAVYDDTGCPQVATELACNDDFCGLQSQVNVTVVGGQSYRIRVGSFSETQTPPTGMGTLTITPLAGPVTNLSCSGTGDNYSLSFDYPAGAAAPDTVEINSTEPGVVNPIATLTFPTNTFNGTLLVANQGLPNNLTFTFNYSGAVGSSTATCDVALNPQVGEDCASAIALTASSFPVSWDNSTFASNGPVPSCAGQIGADIYYTYTPTAPNNFLDVTLTTTLDTLLVAYSGTCGNLTEIDCSDFPNAVGFPVTPGDTYTIRVASWSTVTTGSGSLDITESMFTLPTNDDCVDAIQLAGSNFTVGFNSTLFTTDGPANCGGLGSDGWFEYIPAAGSEATVSLCGSSFDTVLSVYDGATCPPTALIECSDDDCGTQSEITISITPGNSYLIQVGGFNGASGTGSLVITPNQDPVTNLACSATGDMYDISWDNPVTGGAGDMIEINSTEPGAVNPIATVAWPATSIPTGTLLPSNQGMFINVTFDVVYNGAVGSATVTCVQPFNAPPGDNCGNPLVLVAPMDMAGFDTNTGTTDGPAVSCGLGQINNDSWFQYTPIAGTDQIRVSLCGSSIDTVLAVYEGTGCPPAAELVCNDDSCGLQSEVEIGVTPGIDYLIRVGGFGTGSLGTGTVTVEPVQAQVSALTCVASATPDTADVSWTNPATGAAGDMIEISSNEPGVTNPVATVAWPATSTSITLLAANAGLPIGLTFDVVYIGAVGTSTPVSCDVNLNPPANDLCANAIDLGTGTVSTTWNNTGAGTDGLPSTCADGDADIWYLYTPSAGTNVVEVSTCGVATVDTMIAVYEDNGTCPPAAAQEIACNDQFCGNQSQVTVNVTPGQAYLVRVAGWIAGTAQGDGVLDIGPVCTDITNFTATFDCNTQVVSLAWDENDAYTTLALTANGTPTASQPTPLGIGSSNSATDSPATGMIVTYELTATCANGGVSVVTATVNTTVPSGARHLIVQLEGADDVDSGASLEASLLAASETVDRISSDTDPCMAAYLAAADVIWVLLGTFPNDGELTTAFGNQLHFEAQTNGKHIYLEGGDHWVFDDPSLFDQIDGQDSFAAADGDDSLTSLTAFNATGVMLDLASVFPLPVTYNQANLGGNDWTEQLTLAAPGTGDVDVVSSEVLFRNNPDPGETNYLTGSVAETTSGACVICASFEFGGFGTTADQDALVVAYLGHFGGPPPAGGFQRGDCNDDDAKNIADPVRLLNFLFPPSGTPTPLPCDSSCDANDDGGLNIADAVAMLNVLFPVGPPIAWIAPDLCGVDPTPDALTCVGYTSCP